MAKDTQPSARCVGPWRRSAAKSVSPPRSTARRSSVALALGRASSPRLLASAACFRFAAPALAPELPEQSRFASSCLIRLAVPPTSLRVWSFRRSVTRSVSRVVVENRPGAGTAIGASEVARSAARWLHAAARRCGHLCVQSHAVQETLLRSGEGFRASQPHRPLRAASWP